MMKEVWKSCSSCRKPIHYGQRRFICSVSTCQTTRHFPRFCPSDAGTHVAVVNHRQRLGGEVYAPKEPPISARMPQGGGDSDELRARLMRQMAADKKKGSETKDVLIVASKLKKYIKDRADMNCSADVLEALSDVVRLAANDAIDRARVDGRKTVKARDFGSR